MAQLTTAHVKALRDKLGDDLADFFARHHGVEGETPETDAPEETTDDDDDKTAA